MRYNEGNEKRSTIKNYRKRYLERGKRGLINEMTLRLRLKYKWETVLEESQRKAFQTEGNSRPKVGRTCS